MKQFPHQKEARLHLRAEQLDVSKTRVPTGKFRVYKETIMEEKTLQVPVTREELVIERTILNPDAPQEKDGQTEIIRLPISEERVEITKHPIMLEDIKLHKQQFEEIEEVNETLKKERVKLATDGVCRIIDNDFEHSNPPD